MSWRPRLDPTIPIDDAVGAIGAVIVPRPRDLGGFEVRRALPTAGRRMGGPFIVFGEFGPAESLTGRIHHRDPVGTNQWIEAGSRT